MRSAIGLVIIGMIVAGASPRSDGGRTGASPGALLAGAPGDIVTLKDGRQLKGMQVLKATPGAYVVEILRGGVTLSIPRGQVASVTYDAYIPRKDAGQSRVEQPAESLVPGQRLPSDVVGKLSADISEPSLAAFEGADIVDLLAEIGKRAGLSIQCRESLSELSGEERKWTGRIEPGTTLLRFLEDGLKTFGQLHWEYRSGRILVVARVESRKREEPPGVGEEPSKGAGPTDARVVSGPK